MELRSYERHGEWIIDDIVRRHRISLANKKAFDFVVGLESDMDDVCNQLEQVDSFRARALLNDLMRQQIDYLLLAKDIGKGFDVEEDE